MRFVVEPIRSYNERRKGSLDVEWGFEITSFSRQEKLLKRGEIIMGGQGMKHQQLPYLVSKRQNLAL